MSRVLWDDGQTEAESDLLPLGRLGQPDDIAAAICFLLSDASSWTTGQVVDVEVAGRSSARGRPGCSAVRVTMSTHRVCIGWRIDYNEFTQSDAAGRICERSAMKPLDGVKVLDLTRHMTGPFATQMLSDFGADVIKIESVPHGDQSRRTGTAFTGGESGLFLIWNRGKRSLAIDMRTDAGLEAVRRLAQTADVLIENYRPGVTDQIGIGYDSLRETNPRLIYISLSAFGPSGPWAEDPGTDPVIQAMSGVMSVTGEHDGGPLLVGVPIADYAGAMTGMQAAMLGLLARERTGVGQRIDISMLNALVSSLTTRLASWWFGAEEPSRHGSEHSVVARTRPSRPPTDGRWRACGAPARRGIGSARRSTGWT